jgi:hypothetical protein
VPSILTLRRRDPWWGVEGPAARRARRWHQLVSFLAFVASLTAVSGAGILWAMQIGLAGMLGFQTAFHIG